MTSTAMPQHSDTKAQPCIDWTNLTLGVFLAVSPWLTPGGSSAVMWNAVACGATITIAAGVALPKPNAAAWGPACC